MPTPDPSPDFAPDHAAQPASDSVGAVPPVMPDPALPSAAPAAPAAAAVADDGSPAAPSASAADGAPDNAAGPRAKAQHPPIDLAATTAQLKQHFPALFSGPIKPVKLRIQVDIQQRAPGVFTRPALSAFLRRLTGSTAYLNVLVKASHRFDLDGQPVEPLTDEHRDAAVQELERRRANRPERAPGRPHEGGPRAANGAHQAPADARGDRGPKKPNEPRRERPAEHSTDRPPRRLPEPVVAAEPISDEEREEREQRRRRATLLRDFNNSTLTKANFCALKGIKPDELDRLLAQAQQEFRASAPPPRPPSVDADRDAPRGGPREGSRDARRDSSQEPRRQGPRDGAGPQRGRDGERNRPAAAADAAGGPAAGTSQPARAPRPEREARPVEARPDEIIAERRLAATPQQVFAAWTDPTHVAHWWAADGFALTVQEMDVRAGGHWRFTLHGADGVGHRNQADYIAAFAPERLVYLHGSGDGTPPWFRVTLAIRPSGDDTLLRMRLRFANEALREVAVREQGVPAGVERSFDRLQAYLATMPEHQREVRVSRRIDAAPAEVYAAWTDAARMASWWGPRGMAQPNCEVDAQVGGQWQVTMRTPDGVDYPSSGRFSEVVPAERLVSSLDLSAHPDDFHALFAHVVPSQADRHALDAEQRVSLVANGSGTLVTVDLRFASRGIRDAMVQAGLAQGWKDGLDKLAELLQPPGSVAAEAEALAAAAAPVRPPRPADVRVQAEPLRALVRAIVEKGGSSAAEAERVAAYLVEANLTGHDSHGVGMLPRYVENLLAGGLFANRELRVVSDNGALLTLDGQAGYGQVMGHAAMVLGIERARQHGVAVIGLANSHHIGRIGQWAEQCLAAGMVSVHFVNVISTAIVAPFGGTDGRFVTNPMCVGIPVEGAEPIVLDFATSRIAMGKVRVAHNKGQKLAKGTLIDASGRPTADPAVMFNEPIGALLPFGEHKGYGLAVICEILGGALSGGVTLHGPAAANTIINNMTSFIVDPSRMGTAQRLADEARAFAGWVQASPPAPGKRVMLPGDPERAMRRQRGAEGIPIDATSWAQLLEAGRKLGLDDATMQPLAGLDAA